MGVAVCLAQRLGCHLWCLHPALECWGPSPSCASRLSFLLMSTLGSSRWWPEYLGPWHSSKEPYWILGPWPRPGPALSMESSWQVNHPLGDFYFCLCFSHLEDEKKFFKEIKHLKNKQRCSFNPVLLQHCWMFASQMTKFNQNDFSWVPGQLLALNLISAQLM